MQRLEVRAVLNLNFKLVQAQVVRNCTLPRRLLGSLERIVSRNKDPRTPTEPAQPWVQSLHD
jgi:hypothetical protein